VFLSSLALSVCVFNPLRGCSKARVKKKMAAVDECVESDADLRDWFEDLGGPEWKYIFDDQTFAFSAADASEPFVKGFNPLYTNSDLRGTDDVKTPDAGGQPVVGNFIRPSSFDWKLTVTTSQRTYTEQNITPVYQVKDFVMFRLIWMLIFEFPRGDDDYQEMFEDLYETGSGTLTDQYLKPQYKQKCKVLHDAVYRVGDSPQHSLSIAYSTAAAAGGQAGYVVGPADPGYVVPAATVPAVTSTLQFRVSQTYGGQVKFIEGSFDLGEEIRQGCTLWRDPQEELPDQIMPTLQCFVVCEPAYNFLKVPDSAILSQGQTVFLFSTRYTFSDQ